jgi:hypothetical protein
MVSSALRHTGKASKKVEGLMESLKIKVKAPQAGGR